MSYFNTTNESGTTLKNNVAKAKSQEEEIFEYLKVNYWNKPIKKSFFGITPSKLFEISKQKYPITSIRRALTNLTRQGKLIKTDEKRIGMYGRSEHVWKLNENN